MHCKIKKLHPFNDSITDLKKKKSFLNYKASLKSLSISGKKGGSAYI